MGLHGRHRVPVGVHLSKLVEDALGVLHHHLEGIEAVPVLLVQGPTHVRVKLLHISPRGLRHVPEDGVHHLGLVVLLLAGGNVLRGHAPLGKINVPLLLVHTEDHNRLLAPDLDELGDGADTPPRQLREQDHALDAVVLEQGHVSAHLRDALHLDHDHVIDLRELLLVHASVLRRHGGYLSASEEIARSTGLRCLCGGGSSSGCCERGVRLA
mmetsp:Transcript_15773/g.49582  ORF Transcript_15773/g.49582 Transcript_15773/m.49582 type:complete len:212 (-) Transcript_15773:116-751(-)